MAVRGLAITAVIAAIALQVYRTGWATSLFHQQPCGLYNATEFLLIADRVVVDGQLRWAAGVFRGWKTVPPSAHQQTVHVRGNTIVQLYNHTNDLPSLPSIRYPSTSVLGPGLIDIHVHMNEPGREDWEGIDTATAAAAAGGITTVIDMPLNSFPTTTTAQRVRDKIRLARRKARVDVGFWGGLVPDNAHDSGTLQGILDAGALGFKAFMHPSGINDFAHVSVDDIRAALPVGKAARVPILLHAEDAAHGVDVRSENGTRYATWLKSHPRAMEKAAVRALLDLVRDEQPRNTPLLHIVHLSDAELLPEINLVKEHGAPLTVETCPHYLRFAAEDVRDGDLRFKCAPPIREGDNREALWQGVMQGVIDVVASDHSPAPPSMKTGDDFMAAWGGIAGLQFGLFATWDGLRARGASPARLHTLWGEGPARVAGLVGRKGLLAVGADADVVVWEDAGAVRVTEDAVRHRWKQSAYVGERFLGGRVVATWVRGSLVYAEGALAPQACGGVVLRTE